MTEAKAKLSSYRQSPRKVRLVADLIRGKKVDQALTELDFLPKKASLPVKKLILSAVANAKDQNLDVETLKVKELRVDDGKIMRRYRPVSKGRSHPIRRRTSHINITLAPSTSKAKKETKKSSK